MALIRTGFYLIALLIFQLASFNLAWGQSDGDDVWWRMLHPDDHQRWNDFISRFGGEAPPPSLSLVSKSTNMCKRYDVECEELDKALKDLLSRNDVTQFVGSQPQLEAAICDVQAEVAIGEENSAVSARKKLARAAMLHARAQRLQVHPELKSRYDLEPIPEVYSGFEVAIPLLQRALKLREGLYGASDIRLVRTLRRLAYAQQENDKGQMLGIASLDRALKILESRFGPDGEELLPVLQDLSRSYSDVKRHAQAGVYRDRIVQIETIKVQKFERDQEIKEQEERQAEERERQQYLDERRKQEAEAALQAKELEQKALVDNALSLAWRLLMEKSDFASALQQANLALALHTQYSPQDKSKLFFIYQVFCQIYGQLGDLHHTEVYFNKAISLGDSLFINGNVEVNSSLLNLRENMVDLYASKKKLREARRLAEQNLDILDGLYSPTDKIVALKRLAELCFEDAAPDLAIYYGMMAVNAIQTQRHAIQSFEEQSRSGFAESHSDFYRKLAGWLLDAYRNAEAQQVIRLLEEEEYFSYLSTPPKGVVRSAQIESAPQEQALLNRRAEIKARSLQIGGELAELARVAASRELTPEENSRRNELLAAQESASKAYQETMVDLERLINRESPERQKEIQALNLRMVQPLQATLKVLGEGTVLVHFVLLEKQTKIMLTTANAPPIVHASPVGYQELKEKIASLRRLLKSPGSLSELGSQSRELYKILLGPVEDDLKQAKATTLMLATHGELRYLPFAALHDGEGYLIERYNLAHYSESVRDRLRDRPSVSGSYAAFGLTSGLPGVKLELDGLAQDGWLKGKALTDAAFNKEALRAALDRKPSILHIASHFVFRPGKEDKSFLLLGKGEKLPISDMHSLRFDGVDLVTLSACETAMGGGLDEFGQEISGFASVVQENGAQAVMATLWQVADASTAQLVREFYRQRQQGKNKAESLRLAQIKVMRSQMTQVKQPERGAAPVDKVSANPAIKSSNIGWAHPYYWAPFILMGNWL